MRASRRYLQSIDAAAKQVLARHPDLNVLVTMAGIMRVEDWHTPESFLASAEAVVTTNLLGTIRLIARHSVTVAGQMSALPFRIARSPPDTATGTMGACAWIAMTKPPFLNGNSSPVRLRVPSGKMKNDFRP